LRIRLSKSASRMGQSQSHNDQLQIMSHKQAPLQGCHESATRIARDCSIDVEISDE
jgi:hypothetical protein